nr:immunoglobulin heavy chain junction region [Macaca mulatta]
CARSSGAIYNSLDVW